MSDGKRRQAQSKPIIEIRPFHPAADIFPLMHGAELEELAGDIERRGLIEAITVFDGMIVDGRNRARACQKAGVKPRYTPFQGTADDLPHFIISKNIHRRHLKPEQRHDLFKKVLAWDPTRSDRAIAVDLKVDKNIISRVRREAEATGAAAPVEKRTGRDGKARSQPIRKTKVSKPAPERDIGHSALTENGKTEGAVTNSMRRVAPDDHEPYRGDPDDHGSPQDDPNAWLEFRKSMPSSAAAAIFATEKFLQAPSFKEGEAKTLLSLLDQTHQVLELIEETSTGGTAAS